MFEFLGKLINAYGEFKNICHLGSPAEEYFADNKPYDNIADLAVHVGDEQGFIGSIWNDPVLFLHRCRDTLDDIAGVDSDYAQTHEKNKMKK